MPNAAIVISAASLVTGLVLEVDGWPQRRHQIGVQIGTEPLEDGSEITDHATRQPDVLRLTGIVSTLRGAQRPRTAWEALQRLAGPPPTVVEVITEWGNYPEALILAVAGDTTGRDLTFALTIQEIVRVAAPVQVPELSAAARRAAARAVAAVQRLSTGDGVSIALQIIRLRASLAAGGLSLHEESRGRMELDRLRQIEAGSPTVSYGADGLRTVTQTLPGGARRLTFTPQDAPERPPPNPAMASPPGTRPLTEQVAVGQGEVALIRNTERVMSQAELDRLTAAIRAARIVFRAAQDKEARAEGDVRRAEQQLADLLRNNRFGGPRVDAARSRLASALEALAAASSARGTAADRLAEAKGFRDRFVEARVVAVDGRAAPLSRGRVPLGATSAGQGVTVPERAARPR